MIDISFNPVVSLGPISIRWYGVMVALAVATVVGWTLVEVGWKKRLSMDTAFSAALVGIPSGIIISRLLHVIDDLVQKGSQSQYFQSPLRIIGGEGLTAWGAVLGAAVGIWIFSKLSKFKFAYFADLIAPGIILAQAIGRIGCTINGCCYGTFCDLPWAITYSHPDSFGPIGMPVHPTQVYEIIFNLIVFAILFKLRWRFRPDGSLFLIYLSLYSIWRFGIDFIRDGSVFLLGMHEAQFLSVVILLIAIPTLIIKARWVKKEGTI